MTAAAHTGVMRAAGQDGWVSGAAYGVLALATSGLLFAVNIAGARTLNTSEFGLLAALNGVFVLLGVAFTAVQTHIAALAGTGAIRTVLDVLRRMRTALVVSVVLAGVAVVPLAALIRASVLDAVVVACSALGLLVYAAFIGVLQGRERLLALASLNLVQAALRVGAVVVGSAIGGVSAVLVLTAVAIWVCAGRAVRSAHVALRREAAAPATLTPPTFSLTLVVTAAVGAPTVGDVLVARALLSPPEAGAWAIVAVVGRVMVFFAAIVAVAAYPVLLQGGDRARRALTRALLLVVGAAAVGILVCALAPGFVLTVVMGRRESLAADLLLPYVICASAAAAAAVLGYLVLARRDLLLCTVGLPLVAVLFVLTAVAGRVIGPVPAAWVAAGLLWTATAGLGALAHRAATRAASA